MTQIGDMNRRILIQKRVTGRDAANQPLDQWVDWFRPYAQIRGATGMSAVRARDAGQEIPKGAYSFRINYKPPGYITPANCRVIDEKYGLRFDIIEVRPDLAEREHTDIVCEQGVNHG